MLSYVLKHSKLRKTTKVIKLQWIASIWHQNDLKCSVTSQNIQNNAKLQKWSNYNELHRFDIKTIKNVELRRKTFKTTQKYKTDQITWIASIGCQNDQNKAKLQKWSKFNDLHRLDVKTIKTNLNLNYKSDQNPMTCIDLTSKRSKMLSYVAKHSKQRKTTKPINLQWIASIGCQNDQNKAKLQMWSKFNDLHRFDVKTITNVELRRKTFKTTQNYKTYQFTMNCIDWMSKRSKQSQTTKVIKIQ